MRRPEIPGATPLGEEISEELRTSSLGEYLEAKTSEGFDWTTLRKSIDEAAVERREADAYGLSLGGGEFLDLDTKERASQYMDEKDWLRSPYFRPTIKFEPMTRVKAQYLAEEYDRRRARDEVIRRSPDSTGRALLGFGASLLGNLPDPINLLPGVGGAAKAAGFGKAFLRGAGEAVFETALVDAALIPDLQARGEDVGFMDAVADVAFGSVLGGLAGVGGHWLEGRREARMHATVEQRAAVGRALDIALDDMRRGQSPDVSPLREDLENVRRTLRTAPAHESVEDLTGLLVREYGEERGGELARVVRETAEARAAEEGITPDEWIRNNVDVRRGEAEDADIRFAPMYRSQLDLETFLDAPKSGDGSFFSFGHVSEGVVERLRSLGVNVENPEVVLNHSTVRHQQRRHQDITAGDWRQVENILADPHVIEGVELRGGNRFAPPVAFVRFDDGKGRVIVAEHARSKRHGERLFITTRFDDSEANVKNWLEGQRKKKEGRAGPGGLPGSDPSFARSEDAARISPSSPERIYPGVDIVKRWVAPLQSRAGDAPTHVVGSIDELPSHLRRHAEPGDRGVFDVRTGQTWLIADALPDETTALKTWLHENALHRGLRALIPDQERLNHILADVADHFGDEGLRDIADIYGLDLSNFGDRLTAAEEKLAQIAERILADDPLTIQEQALWRRVLDAVKRTIREVAPGLLDISDREIADLIHAAHRKVMDGPESAGGLERASDLSPSLASRPGSGAIAFGPDGRLHINLLDNPDPQALAEALAEALENRPKPQAIDWRTEDRPKPLQPVEDVDPLADEADALAEVKALHEAGELLDEEADLIGLADETVAKAEQYGEAYLAVVDCIVEAV